MTFPGFLGNSKGILVQQIGQFFSTSGQLVDIPGMKFTNSGQSIELAGATAVDSGIPVQVAGQMFTTSGQAVYVIGPISGVSSGQEIQVQPVGYDGGTRVQIHMGYEHHKIHEGEHYYVSGFVTKDSGGISDFWFKTANSSVWLHLIFDVQGTDKTTLYAFETSSYDPSSVGVVLTPVNNNRNSLNTSIMSLDNGSVLTVTGDLIFSQSVGALKQTGFIERSKEVILKSNTQYLFRLISGANGNIMSYVAEWYEHARKD